MRLLRAFFALVALLTMQVCPARAEQVLRFAVVLGNNYAEGQGNPTQALRYADDDAVATHRLLLQAGVDSTLLVRLDEDSRRLYPELKQHGLPRVAELDRTIASIFTRMRQVRTSSVATELLVFYSGHGDVDQGEGYVVLEDGRLTRSKLYSLLAQSPAQHNHVFVDACKSYYLAFDRGPGGQHSAYPLPFAERSVPARLTNTGFVLSTSSDRDSHEWERYQAGILSHELRSALRGAADVNGDGSVTYAELGAFLMVANHSIPNARFRPEFTVHAPEADLASEVLHWDPDTSSLRLIGQTTGHVYVETVRGERVLDAHPARQQILTLHLPSERPLFVRRNDESAEYVITSSEPVRLSSLASAAPAIARRGALSLAFEQLFASPFGERDVVEFLSRPERTHSRDVATAPPTNNRRALKVVAASVALAAAAGGLTLGIVSTEKSLSGGNESQRELAKRNTSIKTLNWASVGLFALAGAAGLTWGWAEFSPSTSIAVQTSLGKQGTTPEMTFEWTQRF